MNIRLPLTFGLLLAELAAGLVPAQESAPTDPLPHWNDGAAKQSILDFVARTTDPSSADFVPPDERIAVFDNDGTLWCEKPLYFQLVFALDRVRELAPSHPEWSENATFRAILEHDQEAMAAWDVPEVLEVVMATHAGMAEAEFAEIASDWTASAQHPRFERPYVELVYQPMLELLEHLRANGYQTHICSGGGQAFIRLLAEDLYGIPPQWVIGSAIQTSYEVIDGTPALVRQATLVEPVNDRTGKPVNIQRQIGRVPVIAVGNSDGDFQMMEWTDARPGPSLQVLLHHDDAEREYDYDHGTEMALEQAAERGWTVVSIREDFAQVFPPAD